MDIRELEQEVLQDAANVLVLAPLTPDGTSAYLDLLAAMCPADTNLTVVTYTQPPDLWLADWNNRQSAIPGAVSLIHGGPSAGGDVEDEEAGVTSEQVSPRDPMDIISTVTTALQGERSVVVSVQTLTVLLEYVDFNTAFRYLHVLIHRIRGSDAKGFYQMDPNIHEAETINTLSVLFDIVVRPEQRADGTTDWSIVSAMPDADERLPPDEVAVGPIHPPDEESRSRSRLQSVVSTLVGALRRTDQEIGQGSASNEASPPSTAEHDEPKPATDEIPPDEELLTDEERIERLLLESGGRMSQADIVENTHWSSPSVSRKLSAMEEEGLITRVQVGRGNLVFLDGHQPDIHGSGIDDEENEFETFR